MPVDFLGAYLRTNNRQPTADRDSHVGEGSQLKGKIQSRQQELGKEWEGLDEEGLRTELRQTSWARQVENHGMEEPLKKNLHRREEQDK